MAIHKKRCWRSEDPDEECSCDGVYVEVNFLRAALRKLEFSGSHDHWGMNECPGICPECSQHKGCDHHKDCSVGQALILN
jgi:hypothetical protein